MAYAAYGGTVLLLALLWLFGAYGAAPGKADSAGKGPLNRVAAAHLQSGSAPSDTIVLYDGALGGTPDGQGFTFLTFPFQAEATQEYAGGATTLDTTPSRQEQAGYFSRAAWMPTLNRSVGYTVTFSVQLLAEAHGTPHRAGFSVIVLSDDGRGIELGFWQDEIWAQADGAQPPGSDLFTHAEGVAADTTAARTYDLHVQGEQYRLATEGSVLLTGPVRDYSAFTGPIDPYESRNFLFLGDDTSSAEATARLFRVAITIPHESAVLYLPHVRGPVEPPTRRGPAQHSRGAHGWCD